MIIGTAISTLIDGPDKRMNFDSEEMDSVEAKWYLSLINIKFEVVSLESLKSRLLSGRGKVRLFREKLHTNHSPRNQKKRSVVETAPNPRILEVVADSDNGLDDGLVPYETPDSDEEDEDEDPTLVRRDKPIPPVYVDISPLGALRLSNMLQATFAI
jgi:telomere length regulation protein